MLKKMEIEINKEKYSVLAEWVKDTLWIHCQGQTWSYQSTSGQRRKTSKAVLAGANIISPMPGKVVKVFVKEGQELKVGESVVVVEAMKMEHTLKASSACKVEKISVQVGQQVQLAELLVAMKELK